MTSDNYVSPYVREAAERAKRSEPRAECAEARRIAIQGHLDELHDYFDNRMDADCVDGQFVPNEEMKLLDVVEDLRRLTEEEFNA